MSQNGPVKRYITDWVEFFNPDESPVTGRCAEWRPKQSQPIRGRLYGLVARVLSRWTEQIFSVEFTESWEVRSEEARSTEVCVRWDPALKMGRPITAAKMEWGHATLGASND